MLEIPVHHRQINPMFLQSSISLVEIFVEYRIKHVIR